MIHHMSHDVMVRNVTKHLLINFIEAKYLQELTYVHWFPIVRSNLCPDNPNFLPGIGTYQLQFNAINVFSNNFVEIWNKTSWCIDQMK